MADVTLKTMSRHQARQVVTAPAPGKRVEVVITNDRTGVRKCYRIRKPRGQVHVDVDNPGRRNVRMGLVTRDDHQGRPVTKFTVFSPKNRRFIEGAKRLGGRWNWNHKVWTFHAGWEAQVRDLVNTVYGPGHDTTLDGAQFLVESLHQVDHKEGRLLGRLDEEDGRVRFQMGIDAMNTVMEGNDGFDLSVKAFRWFVGNLDQESPVYPDHIRVERTDFCCVCGRRLTTDLSRAVLMGPTCRKNNPRKAWLLAQASLDARVIETVRQSLPDSFWVDRTVEAPVRAVVNAADANVPQEAPEAATTVEEVSAQHRRALQLANVQRKRQEAAEQERRERAEERLAYLHTTREDRERVNEDFGAAAANVIAGGGARVAGHDVPVIDPEDTDRDLSEAYQAPVAVPVQELEASERFSGLELD